MRTRLAFSLVALLATLNAGGAFATITIVNTDSPGEGFNDPTPAIPVGGNPGITIGQQRLNLFNQAASVWDAILNSPVEIRVDAAFDPLFCAATSAVLGSAGPNTIEYGFTGAGFPLTWYATAEANSLTGSDLEPAYDDIGATFNSSLGTPGCLTGRNWYYGFDGDEGTSGIDLLPVLLHEIGHGLGFLTFTDESTGDYWAGMPTIFDRYLLDDVTGKHWIDMTPAERVTSAINSTHLVWDGPAVTRVAPVFLGKRPYVTVSGALTASFDALQAAFGGPLTTAGFSGDVVDVNDGVAPLADACETPFVNAAAVAGHIVLIDRGTCLFAQKAINAQAAGATAIVFVHNVAGTPSTVSGNAPSITIPIASISLGDGAAIRAALGSGTVHLTMGLDPIHHAGANDADFVRMYAPGVDQPGSSVSHWDSPAFPNLLMEPAANADLIPGNVDMTTYLFRDIGWFAGVLAVADAKPTAVALEIGPNPVRDGSTLRFSLPSESGVELAIFDVAGRRVTQLARGRYVAGAHSIAWKRVDDQGQRVVPGVYMARLRVGNAVRTAQLVLID